MIAACFSSADAVDLIDLQVMNTSGVEIKWTEVDLGGALVPVGYLPDGIDKTSLYTPWNRKNCTLRFRESASNVDYEIEVPLSPNEKYMKSRGREHMKVIINIGKSYKVTVTIVP